MKLKKYLPILGLVIFVYLLFRLDIGKIFSELEHAIVRYILIALLLVILLMLTQTLKWYVIALKQKIRVPFRDAFRMNLIGNFYGFITPSRIGTMVRAEYLRKYSGGIGKGVSNFVMDKALDIVSLFLLVLFFSVGFKNQFDFLPIYRLAILFVAFILIGLIFMDKERTKFLLGGIYRHLVPTKMKRKTKSTFNSFYKDMPRKRDFFFFLAFNLLSWVVVYLIVFYIAKSLRINLSFVQILAMYPIGTLAAMIPVTISGLGTREAVLISLFSIVGIDAIKVFSMSILALVITTIVPAIWGGLIVLKERAANAS